MATYSIAKVPAGDAIKIAGGALQVPDRPILPFIEGDGTGPDIWRASQAVFDAAVEKAYGGKRQIAWMEVLRRREGVQPLQGLAARRDGRGVQGVPGRHQGTADDADRRRHPLAQRRAAAAARPVRLPASGALLHRRAEPGEAARAGRHGDLPREHRGHLRRHRVGGGERRRRRRSSRSCRTRWASRRSASPRPAASASSRCRARAPSAWCAPPSSTRCAHEAPQRHASCTRATS